MDCIRVGLGKVRTEEGDLKARRKLKDKEDRAGDQRSKDKSQPALGQGLKEGGKHATHGRPEGRWGRVTNQWWIL